MQLEALRDHRPPWPRQIVAPILLTVEMLSLGGERLTPFTHLLILEDLGHHQSLTSYSLYYPGALQKTHLNS